MSGGPLIGGGMVGILAGVTLLGIGFMRVNVDAIYTGAGLALTGLLMIEIGKRVPY